MKPYKLVYIINLLIVSLFLPACKQNSEWKLSEQDQHFDEENDYFDNNRHLSRRPFVITVRGNHDLVISRKTEIFSAMDSFSRPKSFDVDCDGDGIFENRLITENVTCKASIGTRHYIAVRGDITTLNITSKDRGHTLMNRDDDEIISLDQWGDIAWSDLDIFSYSFHDASIIYRPNDIPDLSHTTSLDDWSRPYKCFQSSVENWDVSHITSMNYTFRYAKPYQKFHFYNDEDRQTIYPWIMFAERMSAQPHKIPITKENATCKPFNAPIGNWDVSNVTSMTGMFMNAPQFNQPIGNWNVSYVTSMAAMFEGAKNFNQPIENWNVSNVEDTYLMFAGATSFNQPIGNWNVSRVNNMAGMFEEATNFNQPLDNWNVSSVISMEDMFKYATNFNQPIGNWDVSRVNKMKSMFEGATNFNQPIGNWNVQKLRDASYMFKSATHFNQPLDNWNLQSISNKSGIFYKADAFKQEIPRSLK